MGLVIVAGAVGSGDPIVAVKTAGGAIAWSTGGSLSPAIPSVTTNMALDTTTSTDTNHPTPVLYVNSGDNFYAMHIAPDGVDKYCTNLISGLIGSPIVFGAGASALAVVTGTSTLHAFALNPSKVALALIGGHGLADFVKVLHHGRFAFGAELSSLGESVFDFGRHCVGGSEEFLDPGILFVNPAAHFGAFGFVGVVQPDNFGELSVGKVIFAFEPRQLGPSALFHCSLAGSRMKVDASVRDSAHQQTAEQDEPGFFQVSHLTLPLSPAFGGEGNLRTQAHA